MKFGKDQNRVVNRRDGIRNGLDRRVRITDPQQFTVHFLGKWDRLDRLAGSNRLLFVALNLAVALVASHIDFSVGHRVFNLAIFFMRVSTVWKSTCHDKGSNLPKVTTHLFGNHVPQLKLSNPWRVDQVSAEFQRDQLGSGRGVASLLIFHTDF